MVHGLGADLSFWFLAGLPVLSRMFRVTAYDLRGHGHSEMPRTGYSTADMAADLGGLLDHLGLERPHVVAHSFGAAVALHLAARDPERLRSLVLADPAIPLLQRGRSL